MWWSYRSKQGCFAQDLPKPDLLQTSRSAVGQDLGWDAGYCKGSGMKKCKSASSIFQF